MMATSDTFLGSIRRFFRDYLTAMEARGSFGGLMRQAMADATLRQRLLQAPQQTLAEAGIRLPAGLQVEFLENTDQVVHLVLPPLLNTDDTEGVTP
jgi:hypothetical protein